MGEWRGRAMGVRYTIVDAVVDAKINVDINM